MVEKYRRYRAERMPFPMTAAHALRNVREVKDVPEPFASWDADPGDELTYEEGPFQVTVRVVDDHDAQPAGTFTQKWSPWAVEVARIVGPENWPTSGYDARLPYYERVSGTYAEDRQWMLDQKYPRWYADIEARRYEREDVLEAVDYHAVGVEVTVRAEGIRVGSASLWDISYRDYDDEMRGYVRVEAWGVADEALDDARENMKRLCAVGAQQE
jgi:hypothetical protein